MGDAAGPFDATAWTRDFADPQLNSIVVEALRNNQDLQAAEARLRAALASSASDRAEAFPELSLNGSGSKSRRNVSTDEGQDGSRQTSYSLNGVLAWEVDVWGKARNGYRAELATAQAAVEAFRGAKLSLAARAAKAWYAAIFAQQQLELELRILDALKSSQQIVEEGFESGLSRALDVRLVRANVADSESNVEQRRRNRDAAVRALEVLLGRYPANELGLAQALPELSAPIPAGLPSDLLLRRPDVAEAERRLAAAEQRKYEASKARLPSLNLRLTRGTSVPDASQLLDFVEQRVWTQSLSLAQTLFGAGRLKARFERDKANYEAAVASYVSDVLTAMREAEDALAEQSSFEIDYAAQTIAANESIEAEKLAWDEYSRGLSDITTALDAVRRSVSAQRNLLDVMNQRIQSRIDLYLALGGGFEMVEELPRT